MSNLTNISFDMFSEPAVEVTELMPANPLVEAFADLTENGLFVEGEIEVDEIQFTK